MLCRNSELGCGQSGPPLLLRERKLLPRLAPPEQQRLPSAQACQLFIGNSLPAPYSPLLHDLSKLTVEPLLIASYCCAQCGPIGAGWMAPQPDPLRQVWSAPLLPREKKLLPVSQK